MYMALDKFLRSVMANPPFPAVSTATKEPDGLLMSGGELSPEYVIAAYANGIFPWFNPGQPILWWAPSQRMVLNYQNLKISHSLRKTLKKIQRQARSNVPNLRSHDASGNHFTIQPLRRHKDNNPALEISTDRLSLVASQDRPFNKDSTSESHTDKHYTIKLDTAFERVMRACAEPREHEQGTWISEDFIQAYGELHDIGLAHSFETWCNGELVGGLYGVSIGKMFFGESMFSRQADASKIALVFAANYLADQGIYNIDCQQDTPHLRSMGADLMPREDFTNLLGRTILEGPIVWRRGSINPGILLL